MTTRAWQIVIACSAAAGLGAVLLAYVTLGALAAPVVDFAKLTGDVTRSQVLDRHGTPLNRTYVNDWNLHNGVPLAGMPPFLVTAFLYAEDQRFFEHSGQDWLARLSALGQNLLALDSVRGASTITEQVVRMIRPRPRTLWSRWLEGWEAERLEQVHDKHSILEFYLNQVPYAANRRGVVQAARYYFDRDLDTLSTHEMLALAVLVRAPSRLDLFRGDGAILKQAMGRLAGRLKAARVLSAADLDRLAQADFDLLKPTLGVAAWHFLDHLTDRFEAGSTVQRTTLDGTLQAELQPLLDRHLASLAARRVDNAALLVADHQTAEILAWVVGGAGNPNVPGHMIDTVTAARQPGSALKPFLYALALERGWTPATLIEDAPLAAPVGSGLHSYSNYSRSFHGPVTLRTALGNSLNIPAVRTIRFTGSGSYLAVLERLGFESLVQHPDHYGDGLALGNGAVTLLQMVQAYAALAQRGVYRELSTRMDDAGRGRTERIFSAETTSLIGNILSDPYARQLEFGTGGLLQLPVQTAVKTGTSSDYRDSWAFGYNDRYVVGAWMGNLDQTPTLAVTGSTGPALMLRTTFDLINRHRDTAPLWLSPRLRRQIICADTGVLFEPHMSCRQRTEYFAPDTFLSSGPARSSARTEDVPPIRLEQPTPGLHMAVDPRLPAADQAYEFRLQGVRQDDLVEWDIDGANPVRKRGPSHLWALSPGRHTVSVRVSRDGLLIAHVNPVAFLVK